jgi:hypothetical protein
MWLTCRFTANVIQIRCNLIQTVLQLNSNNSNWAAILGFLSSVYNRTLTLPEAAQNSSDQVP